MTLEEQLAARREVILRKRAKKGDKFKGSAELRKEINQAQKETNRKIRRTKHDTNPIHIFQAEHRGLTFTQYQILLAKGLLLEDLDTNSDGTACKRFLSGPKPGDFKHRLRDLRRKYRREGLPDKAEETTNHQPITMSNPLGAGSPVPQVNLQDMNKKSHEILDTTQKVVFSGVDFESLPGFYDTKHTPETKLHAVTSYMVTGSFKEASKFSAVPEGTIKHWRKTSEWWPAVSRYVQQARQEELDVQLSGVIHKTIHVIADRLEDGDYKYNAKLDKIVRVPVQAKDAASIADKAISNRNLLRGDATSRTDTSSLAEKIQELKTQFQSFAVKEEKTIEGEIIEP